MPDFGHLSLLSLLFLFNLAEPLSILSNKINYGFIDFLSCFFPFSPVFTSLIFNVSFSLLCAALWVPLRSLLEWCILMCVYGLQITRKIQELTKAPYSCLIIHVLLLTSWISCQFDFSPTRSQSRSCWDINLPHSFATKIVTVPINNKGIGFSTFCSRLSQPPSTCKAAVFKACLMVQNYCVDWTDREEGVVLRLTLRPLLLFTLNTEIIY